MIKFHSISLAENSALYLFSSVFDVSKTNSSPRELNK